MGTIYLTQYPDDTNQNLIGKGSMQAAVTHELKVLDELPPRKTLLNQQLSTIARHPEWYGKPVQIGSYAKVSAANGAKHLLQKRWGKVPHEQGWEFATRHIVEDDGEERTGLFAIFTPSAVQPHRAVHTPVKAELGEATQSGEVITLSDPEVDGKEIVVSPEPEPEISEESAIVAQAEEVIDLREPQPEAPEKTEPEAPEVNSARAAALRDLEALLASNASAKSRRR